MLVFFIVVLSILVLPSLMELALTTLGAFLALFRRSSGTTYLAKGRLVILVPAHNEELCIGETLQALLQLSDPLDDLQIIVIADHCDDRTEEICREMRVTVWPRQGEVIRGKAAALRMGFAHLLKEEFLGVCVVDADTRPERNLPAVVRGAFAKGYGAVQLRYRVDKTEGEMAELRRLGFACINHVRALGRSYWKLSAGIQGNGFALRSDALRQVPYSTDSIVEDVVYHHLLVEEGIQVAYAPESVVWSRMPEGSQERQTQTARWEGGRLRAAVDLGPHLVSKILQGYWRLWEPLCDLLTLPLSYLVLSLLFLLGGPVGKVGFLILFLHVGLGGYFEGVNPLSLKSLQRIFCYLFWKIGQVPSIVGKSFRGAAWVRTGREG